LTRPGFYHLDTCLAPLDEERALVVTEAFEDRGLELLARTFPKLLAVPPAEASERLACNAHCPDGRNVIIDAGAQETIRLLRGEGFRVLPVDTSEFLKSGGSVFCLKMMLPS
jgi:N-dimethylarginine dimethylaminohydrolase